MKRRIEHNGANSPKTERVSRSRTRELDNTTMFNKSYRNLMVANSKSAL